LLVSDGLFGNCQKSERLLPDIYQYHLTVAQRQQLESILLQLIEFGYAWSHEYTQCVISNVLLAYRSGVQFDLGFCSASRTSPLTSARWSGDGDDLVVPGWLSGGGGGGSLDAFPPAARERAASPGTPDEEEYSSVPESDSQPVNEVEEFLQRLSSDDLDALEKYVVDDLVKQRVAERPQEPEEFDVAVKTLPDGDGLNNNDVGELLLCINTGSYTLYDMVSLLARLMGQYCFAR